MGQFFTLMRGEAERDDSVLRFTRSLLVHALQERIAKGWRIDPGDGFEFHFKAASALASVTSELLEFARSSGTRLVHLMMTTELQIGWLPNGPCNPILVGLFARGANDDPS
jgi:hypothetical protein